MCAARCNNLLFTNVYVIYFTIGWKAHELNYALSAILSITIALLICVGLNLQYHSKIYYEKITT